MFQHRESSDAAGDGPRAEATVLVVDDDANVAFVTGDMVELLGYRVLRASNGREALDLLSGDACVDLVLTDVVMPGELNGVALATRVRRTFDIPTVLTTGSPTHHFMNGAGGRFALLLKPFTIGELNTRIASALSAG
ncbi:response regulator [Parasphingopyxis algicola]|uniref:response regulator n=1 Tax=Parasphingopyxis algicola TaxID=2026624 RepID=UPI0015A24705|nr:response regulator [Parasphingopyxis algicola]QLC24014.1 response regulator [Parasphingopyxis algicola]